MKQYPAVDRKKCNACASCLKACDFEAISIVFDEAVGNGLAAIDLQKCTRCGNCVLACHRDAMSQEE